MNQRRRSNKKDEFRSCKSNPTTFDSSCEKDFHSEIKSTSYLSGDQDVQDRSRKSQASKRLKSQFVEKENSDIEYRKYSDYANKDRRSHRDLFLYHRGVKRRIHPHEQKKFHEGHKCGSQFLREDCFQSENHEEHRFRRYYFPDVNNSPENYELWKEKIKKSRKREERGDKVPKLDHNLISDEEIIKQEVEKFHHEGSARTRGYYFERKKSRNEAENKKNSSVENLKKVSNFDPCDIRRENESVKSSRLRKSENSHKNDEFAKDLIQSFDSKSLKMKVAKNVKDFTKNQEVSSLDTDNSSKSIKSQLSKCSSKGDSKKSKPSDISESRESKKSPAKSENDKKSVSGKKEAKEEIIFSDSNNEEEDASKQIKNKSDYQKTKRSKIKSNKRRKYNYYSYNKKTSLLMHLIRKLIASDEESKNLDKRRFSKIDSCIQIKNKITAESSCESSGYDSLKNIQDSGIIQEQSLNVRKYSKSDNLENEIEFIDSEKYCLYKIYKSNDGGILLKESRSVEFNKEEYVIGKRIFKEPESLLQFSEKDEGKSEFCKLRNNSTQTELISTTKIKNLPSKKVARKGSWFRKTYDTKSRKSKTRLVSESTSNSSFPEFSDLEQCRKNRKIYSPSSKTFTYSSQKSTAVDTSDLDRSTFRKIPENKIILLFNSSENEKISEFRSGFLDSAEASICKEIKLNDAIGAKIFTKRSSQKFDLKKRGNFHSSDTSSILVPVSWLKLDNSDLVSQKAKIKESLEKETNSDNLQSLEKQNNNPESPDKHLKKKSKPFFPVFRRKKK